MQFSVAPMMDWTDRHCRYFLRGFSPSALLYTEMIVADALLRGDAARLLRHHPDEHPLALQLGGSEPHKLAAAARMGVDAGYDEINLNCGCPSDRVHAGFFGACLMREPARVAACVEALRAAVAVPVTVKMRVGVIDGGEHLRDRVQSFGEADWRALQEFMRAIAAAGCGRVIVHARKAVLGGLSPEENRAVPPLRYDIVRELKAQWPELSIILNGGLHTLEEVADVQRWCDGVMLGRGAYHRPYILTALEQAFGQRDFARPAESALLERMAHYADKELAHGERLGAIVRHMLGLCAGRPGARDFRRELSEGARLPEAGALLLHRVAQRLRAA
jgi:tRNA-dihydrouridine synthase A